MLKLITSGQTGRYVERRIKMIQISLGFALCTLREEFVVFYSHNDVSHFHCKNSMFRFHFSAFQPAFEVKYGQSSPREMCAASLPVCLRVSEGMNV